MTDFGPLQGLRVLDLTQVLAGPFCTQVLADLGADVVKVEPPGAGDMSRRAGPFHPADGERADAGYFHSVNRNKRAIVIDLKTQEGAKLLRSLVRSYDVIIENFRVGVMESLGLGYEVLAQECPKLVYAAIRGFGDPRSGQSPYANWPAYDVVAQAMGGIMGITGRTDLIPPKLGLVSAILFLASIWRPASLQPFFGRVKPAVVSLSMSRWSMRFSESRERIVHQRSFGNITAEPEGNHHPMIAPFGLFPAKDGAVSLACPSDRFFRELCVRLDAPELANEPGFREEADRRTNRTAVVAAIEQVTIRFTKAELKERLGGHLPFGPVYTMAEIAEDPHFAAREMLPEIECPTIPGRLQIAGVPIKFSETPGKVARRGPGPGEHTDEILTEAGASIEQIAAWRAAGVVR